jgi:hypothetical protein
MAQRVRGSQEGEREVIVGPSNRSFGLLFTLVFLAVGAVPLWRGEPARRWALALAILFGIATLAAPRALTPLNRLWTLIGVALHRVMNPVITAVLFFGAVTPFGVFFQVRRKGVMRRLRRDPDARSYWIDRAHQPASRMDRQF